ncbi:MAG: type II secretion system protein [Alphaproteobacteria bacterium]
MSHKPFLSKAGFSLPEIILVVSVMAIIASLSAPPLIEFMKRRDIQVEENTQNEIVKAMKLYLADRNTLPADTSLTWADEVARYTNLSAQQIANDKWGKPRVYVRLVVTETFLGTPVDIFYVTLHSSGPNRKAEGGAATAGGETIANSGISTSSNNFDALTSTGWWKNKATDTVRIDSFVAAQPAVDDMMIRFTDYADKIAKYNTSLERLQRISEALEVYSTTKYNEAAIACMTVPCTPSAEKYIYYPRSNDGATNPASYYGSNTATDLTTYNSGNAIYNSDTDDTNRRTHMINLMRILGLPDEYCCNAMENITGTKNEVPFFYFSNPRPRTAAGCGTRPDPAVGRTLPARMTVKGINEDTNVCG